MCFVPRINSTFVGVVALSTCTLRHVHRALWITLLVSLCGCTHLRTSETGRWSWGWPPWSRRAEVTADDALKAGAEAGDAAAQYTLGFSLLYGEGLPRNVGEGLAWLRKSGENGYLKAQAALGLLYMKGMPGDVSIDERQAEQWLAKAARQGHASSQASLGALLLSQSSSVRDPEAGVVWLKRAADQGDETAQVALGLMYQKGYVVAQNDTESVRWYSKAAEQGHATAQTQLGIARYRGRGVAQSFDEARIWFERAAAQDNALAMSNLGVMASRGEAMPRDDAQAVAWFRKSAERGCDDARAIRCGLLQGHWRRAKFRRGAGLVRKAADQGHAGAQFRLGLMLASGQGTPQMSQRRNMDRKISTARLSASREVAARESE